MITLFAVLFPAVALPILLLCTHRLVEVAASPVHFWLVVVAGTFATVGGVLDWRFHRCGGRRVAPAERRAEALALLLGIPLFALLACASGVVQPGLLLLPIVAVALAMTAAIAHDETRFHRACGTYETALHRLLVGGNGIAFLTWLHWCFAREFAHG